MSLSNIRAKTRYYIDSLKSHSKTYIYTNSLVFDLPESNTSSVTAVTVDGSALGSGDYLYDSDTQQVTLSSGVASSNSSVIIYYEYTDYSNTELNGYIIRALGDLSINKYRKNKEYFQVNNLSTPTKIIPIPNEGEENLIAFVVGIYIRPNYSEYRLPTLTIKYPKTEDRDMKIRKAVQLFKTNLGHSTEIDLTC